MHGGSDKMYEIGSEFHERTTQIGINKYTNLIDIEKRYVLSGRTAIAYIIKDILSYSIFRKVALPAYCCASMVEPFISKGIEVVFYGIRLNYEKIFEQVEAVLVMDYFGVGSESTFKFAELGKRKKKILIVDATQTAFSRLATYPLADYIFVSYRKWTDCLCAAVYAKKGFSIVSPKKSNDTYVTSWRMAANMKEKYLLHAFGEKDAFLNLYKKANRLLGEYYEDCAPPADEIERFELIDSDYLRQCRRTNATILIRTITEIKRLWKNDAQFMYETLGEEDCPLFVPLLVNADIRDKIQKQLIISGIFCPLHWHIDLNYPYVKTKYHDCEISLVCDQRYGKEEMIREANEISIAVYNLENYLKE